MKEKIIAFIASVKDRELQLKIVLESIINKVDLIHLVLNFYNEVPNWLKDDPKIFVHLNTENKNAHDSVWDFVDAENQVLRVKNNYDLGSYYFILDDDLSYPQNYFDKLIEKIEKYKRRAVITVHGANIKQPVEDYFQCRRVYGFSRELEEDIFVDMAGCGTVAFYSSTIKPTLQDFSVVFCRDLWFSILCKKNNIPIISVARPLNWLMGLKTPGDTVYDATHRSENLQFVKNKILKEIFVPLLFSGDSNNFGIANKEGGV